MKHLTEKALIALAMLALIPFTIFSQSINESFSDGDFTSGTVWSGDAASWEIAANSTAASGATGSNTLHLNVPTGGGTQHLSTPFSNWQDIQTWSFFIGRRLQAFTSENQMEIWLYANEADLESATVDGYRLLIGDSGGDDDIFFETITDGAMANQVSLASIPNALTDIGLSVKVTRDQDGLWTLFTSAIPVANGTGNTADLDPLVQASITQLSTTETTYTPSGSGYFGIAATHSTSGNARTTVEFDQFVLTSALALTKVQFEVPIAITNNENDGTIQIPVQIENPDGSVATTVDVILLSGDGTRIDNYTTQSLTFPAGDGTSQNVSVNLSDNTDCDDEEDITFELQNIAGGNSAFLGPDIQSALKIIDDEMGYKTIETDDIEDGDISDWIPDAPAEWEASTSATINGTYSLRHIDIGVAGSSTISKDMDGQCLLGLTTTWRFNVKYFNNDPSATNYFEVYLAANDKDLGSATLDGYMLSAEPAGVGLQDYLQLWKVVDGVPTTAIITTTLDWGATLLEVGMEVTRDENGNWELLADQDGDFDNLVSEGTGTNTDYLFMDYFGVAFTYTSSNAGEFSIDDVDVAQKGCRKIYYSQSTGNAEAAIWADQAVGAAQAITYSRYTRLVIQNGHTVSLNADLVSDDFTVASGGILNTSIANLKLYGNFVNDGTFNEDNSNAIFKGDEAQNIMGGVATKFNNLTIDNDLGGVSLLSAADLESVLFLEEGTFNTNGQSFTLLSDATGSASIGEIKSGADINGDVILERFIPAGVQDHVNVGAPLIGLTISDWDDDVVTTGFPGSQYPAYDFVNIRTYDETVLGGLNDGWEEATNVTDALDSEKGYFLYMLANAQTIDVSGAIHKGSYTQNLDYNTTGDNLNDGWNLVVNRYPSEIDWDAVVALSSGVTEYRVFDGDAGTYKIYDGSTGIGDASRYIASSQAFWAKADALGAYIQWDESVKTSTGAPFERDFVEVSEFTLSLSKDYFVDQAFVGFMETANADFETDKDAYKLGSMNENAPSISTVSTDEISLHINILPALNDDTTIPVHLDLIESGTYTLTIEESSAIPMSSCMVLEDLIAGTSTPVEEGYSLDFFSESYSGTRFIIHLSSPMQVESSDVSCFESADGSISAQGVGEGPFLYSWSNSMGEIILQEDNVFGSSTIDGLGSDEYTVEIIGSATSCGTMIETVLIHQPEAETVSSIVEADLCVDPGHGVIFITTENINEYNYELFDGGNNLLLAETLVFGDTYIEDLLGDDYQIELTTGCNTFTINADLLDPSAPVAQIQAETTELVLEDGLAEISLFAELENTDEVSWYINNEFVSNLNSFTHEFTESGDYTILLEAIGVSCSASDELIIHVNDEVVSVEDMSQNFMSIIQSGSLLSYNFGNTKLNSVNLRLMNSLGQIVSDELLQNVSGESHSIDYSELASGVYTVSVFEGERIIFTQKVVF